MSVFVVAQLRFTDRSRYDRYQARFMEVFTRYTGKLLAADDAPRLVEGSAVPDKIVILSFSSQEDFWAWSDSPEYREISVDRHAGAEATVLLVRGLSD